MIGSMDIDEINRRAMARRTTMAYVRQPKIKPVARISKPEPPRKVDRYA